MSPTSPNHIIKRAKTVYGIPREPPIQIINQNQSEQSEESNPTSPLPFLNRKSLQDQLAEIDNLDDDQLPPIPSSQGEVQLSPTVSTTHDQTGSTMNRLCSSQSNFTTQPPTSISKSIAALTGSPSSHGPFTPPDLSPSLLRPPVEKEQNHTRNRIRISNSDDEDEEDQLLPKPNTKAISPPPQHWILSVKMTMTFYLNFDPTYIDEEGGGTRNR
ncbi:uncharacterized protein MELLADRAFT_86279 [Melampsora larici-populina 98AG31]|uniref:Uncharacterized protein n=1 Tax=Melampsora larici-populina (strain 98AG31 / pathotype 3-4-7) TaxID=747676 RepID=F4RL66_MELLP|nr:uncharacterized protein MELLADRAFT_86279 [Melampsora larici-populina 98AG31]EGG06850.1 hypothetical protein MELLADRAFT_86279 [Melampsora larici-populina 98AG31]